MILITGASSGLGAALAELYSADGTPLVLTGRSEQRLSSIAGNLSGQVQVKQADLCEPQDISQLLDSLELVPETVIHCAGSGYFGPIEDQEPSEINKLIQNNVTSTILLLRELVKRYRNRKVNVVVVMSTRRSLPRRGSLPIVRLNGLCVVLSNLSVSN